jgi:hypothetical protein
MYMRLMSCTMVQMRTQEKKERLCMLNMEEREERLSMLSMATSQLLNLAHNQGSFYYNLHIL